MADVKAVDRPIDAQSIPRGKCMIQAVWRDEEGNLYVKQAVGDGRVLCADMSLRVNLLWSFIAAWISMMAATFGIDIAEIEEDPKREKSALVGLNGKALELPDGKAN